MYDTIKRFFLPVFLGILVAAGIIFLIFLNLRINQERAKLQSEIENLTGELQKSQAEKEELLSKISEAQTGEYLEKIARQELNLQKQGEKVVAFPVTKEKEKEKEIEEKSFWQKILAWLRIKFTGGHPR